MPNRNRAKLTMLGVAAFATASVAGIAAARYTEGDAFAFYKERSAPWPDTSVTQAVPASWSYPAADATQQQAVVGGAVASNPYYRNPAYVAPAMPEPVYVAYQPTYSMTDDRPARVAADYPVIKPERGSWSEPARADADEGQAPDADAQPERAQQSDAQAEAPADAPADAENTPS